VPSRCLSGRQRGRWLAKAPDPGASNNGRLVNFCDCHPCDRLEAPGGATRSSASSSRCRTSRRRSSSSRAWLATRQSGWLAALASSAWASVCSSRPTRFGFILAPVRPIPDAPQQQWKQTQRCPKGPPGDARAFACEGSCGFVRCRAGRRPPGRATGVSSTGCALRLLPPAHATARAEARGRAERHRSRACPSRPGIPGPTHIPFWGRAGPWLVPWTWSGKRRPGQVRRSNHLSGSSSGHNR
jgi:hypothetical protein